MTDILNTLKAETVYRFMLLPYHVFQLMKLFHINFDFEAHMAGSWIHCIPTTSPSLPLQTNGVTPNISRRGHATFTAELLPEENASLTEAI